MQNRKAEPSGYPRPVMVDRSKTFGRMPEIDPRAESMYRFNPFGDIFRTDDAFRPVRRR